LKTLDESRVKEIIQEVFAENFDSATGQIVNVHRQIRTFGEDSCHNITQDQIKFVNQAVSIAFFEFYNLMENVANDLSRVLLKELKKK